MYQYNWFEAEQATKRRIENHQKSIVQKNYDQMTICMIKHSVKKMVVAYPQSESIIRALDDSEFKNHKTPAYYLLKIEELLRYHGIIDNPSISKGIEEIKGGLSTLSVPQ